MAKKKAPAKKRVQSKSADGCKTVLPMRGVGPQQQPVLMGDPCCREGLQIFKAGFRAMKDSTVRAHLKDFNNALTASEGQMMDYCVMVWGLRQEERDRMVEEVRVRYQLAQIK